MTGGNTMERVYLSLGMVLHCLLNALLDEGERRRLGYDGCEGLAWL